jgi:hypothetical protein
MKLLILAALLTAMQAAPPMPGKAGNPPSRGSDNVAKQTKGSKDNASSVAVHEEPKSATPYDKTHTEAAEYEKNHVVADVRTLPEKDTWDKVYICLTFALVVIATVTLFGIWYQAVKTKDAAEAARDSVRLQEAAMQQWVDLDSWKVWESSKEGKFYRLDFLFDLVNNTGRPLTIHEVHGTIEEQDTVSRESNVLAPHGRDPIQISVPLTKERFEDYAIRKTMLIFKLGGYIVFTDILGRRQRQPFEGLLSCSNGKVTFTGSQPARVKDSNEAT